MDIIFIARKLNQFGGGSNFSLDAMARQMSKLGHDVRIITIRSDLNNIPPDKPYEVLEECKLYKSSNIDIIRHIYQILREHEQSTDIYHIFNPRYGFAGGLYRRGGGDTTTVCRLNTYTFCSNFSMMDGDCHKNCSIYKKYAHDTGPVRERLQSIPKYTAQTLFEPKVLSSMDQLFAISPSISRIYQQVGLPKSKITVHPNFYDPGFDKNPSIKNVETSKNPSNLSILYVGRVERFKGIMDLICAIDEINVGANLEIVGDGEHMQEIVQEVEKRNIQSQVDFRGWIDNKELASIYKNSDVFVHPGRWPEPFGRTLLETMQCRTPPIVSNVGAPSWVVGNAGLVFERGNIDDIVKKLESFHKDQELQASLKQNCEARINDFHPKKVTSGILADYKSLTN